MPNQNPRRPASFTFSRDPESAEGSASATTMNAMHARVALLLLLSLTLAGCSIFTGDPALVRDLKSDSLEANRIATSYLGSRGMGMTGSMAPGVRSRAAQCLAWYKDLPRGERKLLADSYPDFKSRQIRY